MATSTKSASPKTPKAKAAKPSANGTGAPKKSKRLRLFELLVKHPEGLGNAAIRAALKTESIAAVCRDEAVAGRLKVLQLEDARGKVFALSAAGRKAVEKGTVDLQAAPKADWPA